MSSVLRDHAYGFAILGLISSITVAADPWRFEPQVLDADIGKVCYAVTVADVNGDAKPDVVAVSENRVQWYENPSWAKHVILENQTELDNVCIAAHDINGDGQIDFALGAGWTKIGTLQWIARTSDPNTNWTVHPIGRELSTHRMSFADVLGTGRKQLIVSPLLKSTAPGARLLAFEIPADPQAGPWVPTVLDESLNRMHNHFHVDLDGRTPIDTIAAAEEGVFQIAKGTGSRFAKKQLGRGADGDKPELRGAGEIKVGQIKGTKFLATVEPMHGTMAVVYLPPTEASGLWQRIVLDESLKQGHAVSTADLDGDGVDEVVVGHREAGPGPITGPGLYVYQATDAAGKTWQKSVVDNGGVAVEDALAADLNADGRPDLIAGGRATHNVKVYWNHAAQ